MAKSKRKLILTTLFATIGILIGAISTTLTWFAKMNGLDLGIGGSVLSEYFDSGDGSQDDPFIITRPKHWENLVWLHNNVSNFYQAITDDSNPEGTSEKGYYFQVGKLNPEIDDGKFYVYDYDDTGMLVPGSTKLTSRVLNLKGLGSLIPIGSSNKPFIGEIYSDGITVSGFDVLGFEDRNNNLVKDADEIGFNDVGIFGYIGKNSQVSNLYFDDFVIHLANANPSEGENNDLHNTFFHDTNNDGTLDKVYAGYIAGHIHSTSGINNVYINNCKFDGGTAALSGFSYFGLAEKDDGNPKPTPMEEIIATKLEGDGSSFGGSIDFYSVYDRLATIYSSAPNESQTKYVSAETVVQNNVTGDNFIFQQTKSNVVGWGKFNNATVGYRYYDTESGGVFNISTQSNEYGDRPTTSSPNIYQCLFGESIHYTKTVTTYTFIDDWYDCFFISNGSHYLNDRYYAEIRDATSESQAAGWRFDGSNHLYTKVFDTTYYLNRNNFSLTIGTSANTTWTKTNDDEFYTVINGTNYYLDFVDTWCLSPYEDRYLIYDGNSNYLRADSSNIFNSTSADNATKFFFTNAGGNSTIGFSYGNQIYYLSNTDDSLTISTTAKTWNKDQDGYYTTVAGISYYIVSEAGQWYLRPKDGVRLSDGNGNYLNSINSNISNTSSENEATIWHFSSTTGDTQIFKVYNGQKYYLTYNNGLTVSTNATTWKRNGQGLYMTIGNLDYYLQFNSSTGWHVMPIEYYLIHDETASNYMKVTGQDSFLNTTSAADATHFYFTNTSSEYPTGSIYFILDNQIYNINAYQNNGVGFLRAETGDPNISWSNDGNHIYVATSTFTYLIEYDNVSWHLRTYADGYYITDGTNYLTVANNVVGNTTDKGNASIFTFSDTTGTYPQGQITAIGQTNGLSRNGTTLQYSETKTNFTNDGSNILDGTYKLSCVNGEWGFVNGSSVTGYMFSKNGYYLSVDSNGSLVTSTTIKTIWNNYQGNIRDTVSGKYIYLNQTNLSLSTTNATNFSSGNNVMYYTVTSGIWIFQTTTYYYVNFNTSTSTFVGGSSSSMPSTSSNASLKIETITYNVAGTSRLEKTDATFYPTKVTHIQEPIPNINVSNYSSNLNMHLNGPIEQDYSQNIFNTQLQNCEKNITNNVRSGNPTYFPLRVDLDDQGRYPSGFAASSRNTGYLISGAHLEETATTQNGSNQGTVGDIRVAGWPLSEISASYNSTSKKFTSMYTVDGNNAIRSMTDAEKLDPTYTAALEQFGTTLGSSSMVYGVHFMDATISTEHTIRANKATILGKTYYNYELPEDSIDFNVYHQGRISFFAGEYFTNNNTFFSLHRVFRDEKNDISAIKEIVEIYDHAQKHDKATYIYKFSDGTYTNADGSYTGSKTKDAMYSTNPVFKTSWITSPSGLSDSASRLFYFSIPCNAGEYALGSVKGKNGAYLCYLDIATNGGDTMLDYIKNKDTVTTFNVDYRSPEVITPHSLLQLGAELPETADPSKLSIFVNFDCSEETCLGTEYSNGIYTITVVNKTGENLELSVLVIDDDDDLYNDYNYAYRIIYTNDVYTEDIIECTPLNDSGGETTDYWKRLAIFEIPSDEEAHESDYEIE